MSSTKKSNQGTQAQSHECTKADKPKPSLIERVAEAMIGVEVPLVLKLVREKRDITGPGRYQGSKWVNPPKRYRHSVSMVLEEVWDATRQELAGYQRPAQIYIPMAEALRRGRAEGGLEVELFDMLAGVLQDGEDLLLQSLAAVREDPKPEEKKPPEKKPAAPGSKPKKVSGKKQGAKPRSHEGTEPQGKSEAGDGLTPQQRKNEKRKAARAAKKRDAGTRGPGDAANEAAFHEQEHAHGPRPTASKSSPTEKEIADVAEFFGEKKAV